MHVHANEKTVKYRQRKAATEYTNSANLLPGFQSPDQKK